MLTEIKPPARRSYILGVYTTLARGIPELVLIVLLFYAGTDALNRVLAVLGLPAVVGGGFAVGVLVIGIVQRAFAAEVLRGAILSIPLAEIEAGRSFGMPAALMYRRVVLPAMLPHALPGLSNLWLVTVKDTALLAVVGYSELTLKTRQAAGGSKAYLLFYCAAGLLYFTVTPLSHLGLRVLALRVQRWTPRFP